MKRSRFSDEQIISVLKEQEAGRGRAAVCRQHGAARRSFTNRGRSSAVSRCPRPLRLRTLEEENAQLEKQLAVDIRDNAVLKDLSSVNW
jgi:putative transposase